MSCRWKVLGMGCAKSCRAAYGVRVRIQCRSEKVNELRLRFFTWRGCRDRWWWIDILEEEVQ